MIIFKLRPHRTTNGIALPITRLGKPLPRNQATLGGRCAWALLGIVKRAGVSKDNLNS